MAAAAGAAPTVRGASGNADAIPAAAAPVTQRRQDDTTMPTASAAAPLADPPTPDVAVGTADGAAATADSATERGVNGASGTSVTKKRRQKHSRATQDSRKHRRRMSDFAAAQGGTSGSDPGTVEGHPAGGSD